MFKFDFIFTPGLWLGKGEISFSASPSHLEFLTRWEIETKKDGLIRAYQIVEMTDLEKQINRFVFYNIEDGSFAVQLHNEILGKVSGVGLFTSNSIIWEYHPNQALEGFEFYLFNEEGNHLFHAEYGMSTSFGSQIDGHIMKLE